MVATIIKTLDKTLLYQGFDRFLQLFPLNKFEIVGETHCYSIFICLI